jgi:hypothetical protein
MAGAGKHKQLNQHLKRVADLRGLPFSLTMRSITGSGGGEATEGEDEGAGEAEAGQIQYETSSVHIGFDVARMSMQDKQILRPILLNFGQGSQVLAGNQGRGARILVLYHAHLLSSESVLLLQACLEQNEGDVSIWLTSEMPVPHRIRDWFVELPVRGDDAGLEKFTAGLKTQEQVASWQLIFTNLLQKWIDSPEPTIESIKEVKSFIYELLMRNLRWVEATHFLLDVILVHKGMTAEQRAKCLNALSICEATAGGYTIPSYRIPILWESLFIQFRTILAKPMPKLENASTTGTKHIVRRSKAGPRSSTNTVESI